MGKLLTIIGSIMILAGAIWALNSFLHVAYEQGYAPETIGTAAFAYLMGGQFLAAVAIFVSGWVALAAGVLRAGLDRRSPRSDAPRA